MNDLETLKEYLQYKLDNGFHKLFYNDLDWDIKTIDCINAINDLQQEKQQLKERINKANDKIDKAIDKLICYGEMLDARFQSDMLDILEESDNNDE